jgi:hypothetical protein
MSVIEVQLTRDWVDYATLAATAFAALGTVGAVFWAIFGPAWRQRRRRPVLTLVNENEGGEALYEKDEPRVFDGACLRLQNEPGRETAEGVEVLISVFSELPDIGDEGGVMELPLVSDENLNFNGNDGTAGRSQASVPGGVARRIYIARLGDPQELFYSWQMSPDAEKPTNIDDMCGAWATTPAHQDMIAWLRDGSEYRIELTLAGNNIDAVRYEAKVEVSRAAHAAIDLLEMKHPINVTFNWIEGLSRL